MLSKTVASTQEVEADSVEEAFLGTVIPTEKVDPSVEEAFLGTVTK